MPSDAAPGRVWWAAGVLTAQPGQQMASLSARPAACKEGGKQVAGSARCGLQGLVWELVWEQQGETT